MESRYNRIQEDISRILEGAGMVEARCIEMTDIRRDLPELQEKAFKAEFVTQDISGDGDYNISAFEYPLPYLFLLMPSNIETW